MDIIVMMAQTLLGSVSNRSILHVWILLCVIQTTLSTSNNIPGLDVDNAQAVCDTALNYKSMPGGTVMPADNKKKPYTIKTQSTEYMPGEKLEVTIKSTGEQTFRGFTLQARHHNLLTTGHFTADKDILYDCVDVDDTLVVWYDTDQNNVSFSWRSPDTHIGSITFVANVITSDKNIYPNISTNLIRRGFPEINITGCGVTKGCFSYPQEGESSCTHYTCQYLVTYQRDQGVAYFEMTAMANWAAIGFSSDDKMGGDDVFMCLQRSPSGVDVRYYRNEIAYESPVLQQDDSLTDPEVDMSSGYDRVSCRFRRQMSLGEPHVDLNNDWFQLYAWGPITGTHIGKHTLSRPPTSHMKITLIPRNNVVGDASTLKTFNALIWLITTLTLLYNLGLCQIKNGFT